MPTPPSSVAYEVVRLASRAALSESRAGRLREAAEQIRDWQEVYDTGVHHRTLPLLYTHVRSWAPDEVAETLRRYVHRRTMNVLFLSAEMARIARRLDEAGVPFLTFKGPSLAEAYGGSARRPFVDNDLLISPSDFGVVTDLLVELGFSRRKRSPLRQAGYLQIHGEYTFGRSVGPMVSTVDVHTRLVPIGYPYHGPFEALHARSRPLEIAGVEVPTFSWGDTLLALAVNALKDQWNRLRLASDLAETSRFVDDWPALVERARQTRCLRALRVGMLVSAETVDAVYPDSVLEEARRDVRAGRLARRVLDRLPLAHEEPVMTGSDRLRFTLMAPDGVRGQAQYLAYVGLRRILDPLVTAEGAA